MTTLQSINDIRKAIKPLGFTVKTKTLSWGSHATYIDINTKQGLSFNVFTPELLEKWKPLLDWQRVNRESLKVVRDLTDCRGLL